MNAFIKPEIELVELSVADILTTSGSETPTETTVKPGPINPELPEDPL